MIKTVKVIDAFEFDELVRETYGRPYCFQQQKFLDNSTSYPISVRKISEDYENGNPTFEEWRDRSLNEPFVHPDYERLLLFRAGKSDLSEEQLNQRFPLTIEPETFLWDLHWEREYYPDINYLLKDMLERGLIDEGDYQLSISW